MFLVLLRTFDDGITMDDLDALQQDLEKLLTNCALRNRLFRTEIESIDRVEEKRDKRGKQVNFSFIEIIPSHKFFIRLPLKEKEMMIK